VSARVHTDHRHEHGQADILQQLAGRRWRLRDRLSSPNAV
jgi:hypothetical protein